MDCTARRKLHHDFAIAAEAAALGARVTLVSGPTVLADPHVKRAYLGEEDEALIDPDDKPATAESVA